MTRVLNLRKITIKNFRSITQLTIKQINDITVLVGRNESGKTNILKALIWFSTEDSIEEKDRPQHIPSLGKKLDDISVDLLFEIVRPVEFIKHLISDLYKLKRELGDSFKGFYINKNNILSLADKVKFLRAIKKGNSEKIIELLDRNLKKIDLKWYLEIKSEDILPFIKSILRRVLNKETEEDNHILKDLSQLKDSSLILNISKQITEKIISIFETSEQEEFENSTEEGMPVITLEELKSIIEQDQLDIDEILRKALRDSSDNIVFYSGNIISNLDIPRYYSDIPRSYKTFKTFKEVFKETIINYEKTINNIISRYIPKFIYLAESFNLSGIANKDQNKKWADVLSENSEEYGLIYRWLKILGIDPREIDEKIKTNIDDIVANIKNALWDFTYKFNNYWTQEKLNFDCNISENSISFFVIDVIDDTDNRGYKRVIVKPEERSRGLNWHLAYFITLEYIKREGKPVILLMDDPAVFLHYKGQEDFLKEIKELSENVQIIYSTHLIGLIDLENIENVYLIKKKKAETIVLRPWNSNQDFMETPIYHALGFSHLLFKDVNKILFVEGVSDKFLLEGLKKYIKKLGKWYIYPLVGSDKVDKNKIIRKLCRLSCLANIEELKFKIMLDGDKKILNSASKNNSNSIYVKSSYTDNLGNDCFNRSLLKNVFYLEKGNDASDVEIEDLIEREFYLEQVREYYSIIFSNNLEKYQRVLECIKEIEKTNATNKITKKLDKEFEKRGLGGFDKVGVAIQIKNYLLKNKEAIEYFDQIISIIEKNIE